MINNRINIKFGCLPIHGDLISVYGFSILGSSNVTKKMFSLFLYGIASIYFAVLLLFPMYKLDSLSLI